VDKINNKKLMTLRRVFKARAKASAAAVFTKSTPLKKTKTRSLHRTVVLEHIERPVYEEQTHINANAMLSAPPRMHPGVERNAHRLAADLEYIFTMLQASQRLHSRPKQETVFDDAASGGSGNHLPQTTPKQRPKRKTLRRPWTPIRKDDPQRAVVAALIFLQRLLRGRARQNAMLVGRERRRELIKYLRTCVLQGERMTGSGQSSERSETEHEPNVSTAFEVHLDVTAGSILSSVMLEMVV